MESVKTDSLENILRHLKGRALKSMESVRTGAEKSAIGEVLTCLDLTLKEIRVDRERMNAIEGRLDAIEEKLVTIEGTGGVISNDETPDPDPNRE